MRTAFTCLAGALVLVAAAAWADDPEKPAPPPPAQPAPAQPAPPPPAPPKPAQPQAEQPKQPGRDAVGVDRVMMVGHPRRQIRDFFQEAHLGNLRIMRVSQLAEGRAADQAVKDFAAMMVREHTEADRNLRRLSDSRRLILSDRPGPFRSFGALAGFRAEERAVSRLEALSGRAFDKACLAMQILLHEKQLALLQAAPQVLADRDVSQYCTTNESMIRRHSDTAEQLVRKLDQDGPNGQPPAAE